MSPKNARLGVAFGKRGEIVRNDWTTAPSAVAAKPASRARVSEHERAVVAADHPVQPRRRSARASVNMIPSTVRIVPAFASALWMNSPTGVR